MKQKTGWGTQASTIRVDRCAQSFFVQNFCPKFFLGINTLLKKIRYEPHGERIVNGIKGAFFHMLLFLIHICSIFTGCNSAKESEPAHAPRQRPRVAPFTHVLMGKIRQIAAASVGRLTHRSY